MATNEVLNPYQAVIYLREGRIPLANELREKFSDLKGKRAKDSFWKDIDGAGFILLEHARAERLKLYHWPDNRDEMEHVPFEVLSMEIFLHVLEEQITMNWRKTFQEGPTLRNIRVYRRELELLRTGAGQTSKNRAFEFIKSLIENRKLPTGHGSRVAIAKLLREEPGFQNYSPETLEKYVREVLKNLGISKTGSKPET